MKVLNLYAGIGGNRKEWSNCQVTAVESNPKIAAIYQELHPGDTVVVGDAPGADTKKCRTPKNRP